MKIEVFKTKEAASMAAANIIIKDMILKPDLTLGLSTGSSPLGVYSKLIEAYKKGFISFKDITTFNLDEYIGIDRSHSQSYYRFMRENLFNHVNVNFDNVHIPNNDVEQINTIADTYNQLLHNHTIDVQILGIGSNGHIGFNEPGTPLRNETFIAELDEGTRLDNARFFASLDEVPKYAITMGIKNIMKAQKIIVLALGKYKAKAVQGMIEGPVSNELPASILQLHPNCSIILDEEAASQIKNRP